MGYWMQQIEQAFTIKAENKKAALAAIKELANHEVQWYSWVETKEFVEAETLAKAFDAWRWQVEEEDEDIVYIYFGGEKLGDDEILFKAIAPYVEDGSFIEMSGEDGARWRWIFENGDCIEKDALIDFTASPPRIMIHVEGGNVTGVMANQSIEVEVFDVDNLKAEGKSIEDIDKEWIEMTKGLEEMV